MDKKESDFAAKLLATFKVEADEHLQILSKTILSLETNGNPLQQKQLIEAIFREVHSLKGAARSVNQLTIQTICQAVENVLAALKQERLNISKDIFNSLYVSTDYIQKILSGNAAAIDKEKVSDLLQKLDGFLTDKQLEIPKQTSTLAPKAEQELMKLTALSVDQDKTIRVSEKKLDRLFQEVEEMLSLKLNAHQQNIALKEIQMEVHRWERKWRQSLSGIGALNDVVNDDNVVPSGKKKQLLSFFSFCKWQETFFTYLDNTIKNLLRKTSQDYQFAGSTVDMIIEDTRKLLMQPFSSLFTIFPRMARDLAEATGKEVELTFVGEQVEVDRRILEEVKDPLMHLIRNCIDHGIESKEVRKELHKPPKGIIKIAATQASENIVELEISDDGKGIDLDKVKAAALKAGFIQEQEANKLSETQLISLIFHSGISTSEQITELSGRGVGMGVVQEKVNKLGGHIEIKTTKNKGTLFRLMLPTTLATFRGVSIKLSNREFILPTQCLQRVLSINQERIKNVEGHASIVNQEEVLPLVNLASILHLPMTNQTAETNPLTAIVMKQQELSVAFVVDEVINEQEVLLKPIGHHLTPVPGILAATISQSGEIIPILNPSDLMKFAMCEKAHFLSEKHQEKEKKILIAEDSTTTRLLLKTIIEANGFLTIIAKDGLEAWNLFNSEEEVGLIISDVEMPNMDGLTLTHKIRSSKKGKTVPIILCSSLASKDDQERGTAAGANHYLDKSEFTETKLLNVIHKSLMQ
jgi:two-component system chemotaxis sensor kinase CheA